MLVLKRKIGEVIRISHDIEVHVLGVEGETIKLGFNAPKNVTILRSEVYNAIKEENLNSMVKNTNETEALVEKLGLRNKKV